MVKSLSALAIFALLGAAVVALPSFAPEVKAGEVAALSNGDRLVVRTTNLDCSQQVWPAYLASCLRKPGSEAGILEVRLVTSPR
jgi:hypothetical protein